MYDIAAGIARLESGQSAMVDRFEALEKRLFGNGQPGELAEIKNRITQLEKFKYTLLGIGVAFSAIGGVVGALMDKVFRSLRF